MPVPEGIISTSTGPVDPNALSNEVASDEVVEPTPTPVVEEVVELVEEELPEAEAE